MFSLDRHPALPMQTIDLRRDDVDAVTGEVQFDQSWKLTDDIRKGADVVVGEIQAD